LDKVQVRVLKTLEDVSIAAAQHFLESVLEAVKSRGVARVALSGGSTPHGLFILLSGPPFREQIPWHRIHFYWGDERCVVPEDPESNYGQVRSFCSTMLQ
jgi:6-phosphogluconolactonase